MYFDIDILILEKKIKAFILSRSYIFSPLIQKQDLFNFFAKIRILLVTQEKVQRGGHKTLPSKAKVVLEWISYEEPSTPSHIEKNLLYLKGIKETVIQGLVILLELGWYLDSSSLPASKVINHA